MLVGILLLISIVSIGSIFVRLYTEVLDERRPKPSPRRGPRPIRPTRPGHSTAAVANKFIELANRDGKMLPNHNLQKLVYIAYGFSLALLGKPLTYERAYAFESGPVFPKLSRRISIYGTASVTYRIETDDDVRDPQQIKIIRSVWKNHGRLSDDQLDELTHEVWNQVWAVSRYSEIPEQMIKDHYKHLLLTAA